MLPKRTLPAVLMSCLVAGCAVGPDYVRPALPLPEKFQGQTVAADRPGTASADLSAWWTSFGDPQLTRFVTLALAQNLDLAQAQARVTQARAGLGAAQAALRPVGQFTGQAARAYQSAETPLGQVLGATPGFERAGSAYEAGLGASWELDLFGGLRRGREAAWAEYQASAAGAVATRLAVAAQTADIYITLRGLQARLDLAHRQVQTQQEALATLQLLHGKGLVAEFQVRQAEGALAQWRALVPGLELGLEVALNALDVILGAAPGTYRAETLMAHDRPAAPQMQATGAPGELLRRRPDLIVAERRLAAASARVGMATAEYYPQLSLGGLIGSTTSVSGGHLLSSGASQAAGVLGLRWRLFDFGRIDAQIEQAQGQEAELLAAYRLAVLRATEDVENALAAWTQHDKQVVVLTQGRDALDRARANTEAAYQRGVVNRLELLQAEARVLQAADARVQAQTEAARSAVTAFKALGGGWLPPA